MATPQASAKQHNYTEWKPLGVGIHAYHGVIIRHDADGKPEYATCQHAHNSRGAACKCAEREARRHNREEVAR